jgi:hypothetical protein
MTRADNQLADAKPVGGNEIDIKWRYFSFVKINCKHTLIATRRWVRPRQADVWETWMKNTLVREFELARSLLRTLSEVFGRSFALDEFRNPRQRSVIASTAWAYR